MKNESKATRRAGDSRRLRSILFFCFGGLLIVTAISVVALSGVTVFTAMSAGVIALIGGSGVALLHQSGEFSSKRADLGIAVLASAVVGLALAAVQINADRRARVLEADRATQEEAQQQALDAFTREQERRADTQALSLTLSLQRRLAGIDLRDADLENAYLADKDFSAANIAGANLMGAVLRHSIFTGADLLLARLTSADFRSAKLRKASLRSVVAEGASFCYADLRRVDLRDASLDDSEFTQAHLTRTDLRDASLRGAFFAGTDMRFARLAGAHLEGASFIWATDLSHVRDLDLASLKGADYWPDTKWPRNFDPRSAGAQKLIPASRDDPTAASRASCLGPRPPPPPNPVPVPDEAP